LAVRGELTEAWQPRNALERQLLDQLAQFQTMLERWQELLVARTQLGVVRTQLGVAGKHPMAAWADRHEPPRVSDVQATAEAAGMVERLHRLYLCTLRALQDHRRLQSPAVVRRAEQVNLGHQQINVISYA
jgi:hypothetical protein